MASYPLSQNEFVKLDASQDESAHQLKTTRKPTVYDAVAGRISAAGFIPQQLYISSTRDTPSSSVTAIAPESVLFRHKNAPTRYAEFDIYFENERALKINLPDSDVVKELHCFTSDFYSHYTERDGAGVWRSMDETALLGFGILVEELSRELLGETGDLVFTEGEEINDHQSNRHEITAQSGEQHPPSRMDTASRSSKEKHFKRKKRKLNE